MAQLLYHPTLQGYDWRMNVDSVAHQRSGFTLLELLVVVAIIGVLATVVAVALGPVRLKARDARRKSDVAQFGRFLSLGCFTPQAGAGDYDLAGLAAELAARYPQYASFMGSVPQDPKSGTAAQTNYRYTVTVDGKCALYTNLERTAEPVTLPSLTAPTPGGGSGVLQAAGSGWNGTPIYFQYSS